jgi:hypothetical protein
VRAWFYSGEEAAALLPLFRRGYKPVGTGRRGSLSKIESRLRGPGGKSRKAQGPPPSSFLCLAPSSDGGSADTHSLYADTSESSAGYKTDWQASCNA